MIESVGRKIRALREARGWSRAELCGRAGISVRFLAEVETGEANLSLLRLLELATALGVSVVSLVAGLGPVRDEAEILASLSDDQRARALRAARPPEKVALVGLRGAGKSTVGSMAAQMLGLPFIELDALIEGKAGMHLTEIFEFHGPSRYRELEMRVLSTLLERPGGAVIASGGSVVTSSEAWSLLRGGTRTVWL
ncbi:MAG TPA: shikimate kinase, partial [Myxococcota bacterium]|nr:shikimate kinase [Myxococcota bacterium]